MIEFAVRRKRARLSELIPDGVIVILHAAPMVGVVLPLLPIDIYVAIDIDVDIREIWDDIDWD
jgi:hypothetical protein